MFWNGLFEYSHSCHDTTTHYILQTHDLVKSPIIYRIRTVKNTKMISGSIVSLLQKSEMGICFSALKIFFIDNEEVQALSGCLMDILWSYSTGFK